MRYAEGQNILEASDAMVHSTLTKRCLSTLPGQKSTPFFFSSALWLLSGSLWVAVKRQPH